MTFLLEIITPEQVAYTNQAECVTVPSTMGQLGILPKHIPLFAQLIEGELKIKTGKDELFLAIGGGFLEVTKEKVMILVTRAVKFEELNEAQILVAKKRAEEALSQKIPESEVATAQSMLRQSLVDLKIMRKRKRYTN